MRIVVIGGLILVGFVAGYFFATPVLIAFTVLAVAVGIYLHLTTAEMARLIYHIYVSGAIVAVLAMWATSYVVTGQSFVGVALKSLLR